jgi:glucosamine--fructose-6-phosphate aminotransferase (isomerizing)
MAGLEQLAYRGYDSSGIAVIDPFGNLTVHKAPGKLENLTAVLGNAPLSGSRGIGHTRWATHGGPTEENAHPHIDGSGKVVIVHNGIVENYMELKRRLIAAGHVFTSATDTEVIPHLIQDQLAKGIHFAEAVRLAANELRGAHAIACLHTESPEEMVTLRIGNAGGVTVGHGEGEMFLASDLSALLPLTSSVTALEPGELAIVNPEGCDVITMEGERIDASKLRLTINPVAAAKGGYKHYMLKEIMEQPEAAVSALRGRLSFNPEAITLDEVNLSSEQAKELQRAVFLGMGTSLISSEVGARMMEKLARLPARSESASEYRYRNPVVDANTLGIAVTQSGETADTLEALHQATAGGAKTIAITNSEGSQVSRRADSSILMHAGQEIGVASTKTFINSMVAMYLLAVHLGALRGTLSSDDVALHVEAISALPALLGEAIALNESSYPALVTKYAKSRRFLFLGRGLSEPIAREGALKLKEISYIHAEGMAAGEMKHGPIALVDQETPVVVLAPKDHLYEKVLGNIAEVRARGGRVIALAQVGDDRIDSEADDVLWLPECPELLWPMVATIPAQLFAYHMADEFKNDVDQPRNLAKSVTVE